MVQYHVFPGGKKRIVTMSYDDGNINDVRLIGLFDKYGVKGTFNLNGNHYDGADEKVLAEKRELYKNHEIACHTLQHGFPARMPLQSLVKEVIEDRAVLEKMAGYPVTGMAYPSGSFSDDVCRVLNSCGIVYSRTTRNTNGFQLPDDFLLWHPTCHHRNALPLCDTFMQNIDSRWTGPLFYIWGHSHELVTEDDWKHMETILEKIGNCDKIWYATNMEIYDYMTAQKQVKISYDEKTFVNPTALDLWFELDNTKIIMVPKGSTLKL